MNAWRGLVIEPNMAGCVVDDTGALVVSVPAPAAKVPATIEQIFRLQAELEKQPQRVYPIRNIFAPGVYLREIMLPAGWVVVGAVHKTEHASIISKGRCSVYTVGEGLQELEGPYTFISQPGIKRVVWAHEDTTWTTIHANPTNETDVSKLVEEITTSKFEDLLENRVAAIEGDHHDIRT